MITSPPIPKPQLTDEELEAKFIGFCARFPNYGVFEIARHVFDGQVDGESRSLQAATKWQFDLEIQEKIRQLRLQGEETPKVPSEEQQISALWVIASNETVKPAERIAAQKLIAEMTGRIKKPPEPKGVEKTDLGAEFLLELSAKLPD